MRPCATPPFAPDATLALESRWRAHDLLRLRRLPLFDGEPAWVRAAFERAPYAVVRRALAADGFVAVGLRGTQRSQRYGTWVRVEDVEAVLAPEDLVQRSVLPERASLPAFVTLRSLRDAASIWDGFVWGPAGSSGFELATGLPSVAESSDLDLLMRAPDALAPDAAARLLDRLRGAGERTGVHIDVQLETPAGGVALAEWASGKGRVLARHACGARFTRDPWRAPGFALTDIAGAM